MRGGVVQIAGVFAALASTVAIGCGGDDHDGLASFAPPDAPLYVEAVIDPDDGQSAAVDSLGERFGGGFDPGGELIAAIDELFASNQIDATYSADVEPWIGEDAAAFVRSFESSDVASGLPDFAVMLEVDDADAARDFIGRVFDADPATEEERTYRDTDYFYSADLGGTAVGLIDDYALTFGTEASFKVAVDAAEGESLAGSDEYSSRLETLPDDALASAFFEPASVIEAAIASEGAESADAQLIEPLLGGPLSQPVAAALSATPQTASVDVAADVDSDAPDSTESSLLEQLPGGAWLAAALPELGPTLERNLDQVTSSGLPGAGEIERRIEQETGLSLGPDVLDWLGDAAIFAAGTEAPGFSAGLIAEASDPEAPRKLLDAVQKLVEQNSELRSNGTPTGADYGFSVGIAGLGGGAEAGVVDGILIAALGDTVDEVLYPGQTLGDNPSYAAAIAALGDDLAPALYVDLPSLFAVAEQGSDGDIDYEALRPYVAALGSLIVGSRHVDGLVVSRLTLTLAPE